MVIQAQVFRSAPEQERMRGDGAAIHRQRIGQNRPGGVLDRGHFGCHWSGRRRQARLIWLVVVPQALDCRNARLSLGSGHRRQDARPFESAMRSNLQKVLN